MNVVILYGAIERLNPERHATSGAVRSFRVSTTRVWQDQGGTTRTGRDYHNVVAFGRQANKLASAAEGDRVEIVGMLQTRSYEQSGVKRYTTEVVIGFDGQLTLIPQEQRPAPQQAPAHQSESAPADALDDDIPF